MNRYGVAALTDRRLEFVRHRHKREYTQRFRDFGCLAQACLVRLVGSAASDVNLDYAGESMISMYQWR